MDLLYHRAQVTGLDPLLGHLYMVEDERGQWQIRTTISGLLTAARRAANATGDTLAISEPKWAGPDQVWTSIWTDEAPPVAAQVTVERGGNAFTYTALYREYAVFDNETGRPNRTWWKRPAGQLAKCAKAGALRDACPDELSGLYTDDEMAQAGHDTVRGDVVVVGQTGDTSLAALLDEDD